MYRVVVLYKYIYGGGGFDGNDHCHVKGQICLCHVKADLALRPEQV